MTTLDEAALRHVNQSGFPFQRRVKHAVDSCNDHSFRVDGTELPWVDPDTGQSRFVDMVIAGGRARFVVECKRRSGGSWIFLPTSETPERLELLFLTIEGGNPAVKQATATPGSFISDECVVPGSAEGRRRLLEDDAARVVRATESLAMTTYRELGNPSANQPLFVPMIVTNLPLLVCKFDSARVSINDGTVDPTAASTVEVPWIRFTKSFSHEPRSVGRRLDDFKALRRDRERTVVVVQGSRLNDFLIKLG